MKIDVFKLEITLGNEAMQTADDLAGLLSRFAEHTLRSRGLPLDADFPLFDLNGNSVGFCRMVKRRV